MASKKFIFGKIRNRQFSEMCVVTANTANTTSSNSNFELDKNGLAPIVLTAICGQLPNRGANVLSGTVAQSAGIEHGKTYAVQITETAYDCQYGRRFNVQKLQELSFVDLLLAKKELPKPSILDVVDDQPTAEEVEKFTEAFEAELIDRNGFYLNDTETIVENTTEVEDVNAENETATTTV